MSFSECFESVSAWSRYRLERICSQLEFARFICGKKGDPSGLWTARINELDKILASAMESPESNLPELQRDAEKILAPLSSAAKEYRVYCIGHAHIDMNWMWSWPETVAITNDSFSTVLRLLEEFPNFRFSQSQASVYEIVERYNPQMLEKIRANVKTGKWEVTASHWVENDNNIVGTEALCRHVLYTRKYMQKLFSLNPEDVPINWAPDTFGHAATIPNYLAQSAVKFMYLHRPGTMSSPRPRAFFWKGTDGSQVLVKNDIGIAYNAALGPHIATSYLKDFSEETSLPFVSVVFGVGDHGGGPTRRDILRAMDMDSWPVFPRITFSTAREFFERLEKDAAGKIPSIEGELNFEFTGCYTSQSAIKKSARFAERHLLDLEHCMSLTDRALKSGYDSSMLENSWRPILLSHFHDILPGSCIQESKSHCLGLYQESMAMVSSRQSQSLRALASQIDTRCEGRGDTKKNMLYPIPLAPSSFGSGAGRNGEDGPGSFCPDGTFGSSSVRPYLFMNTLATARKEVVTVDVWDNSSWENVRKDRLKDLSFTAIAPDSTKIACQTLETGAYWGHDFVRVAFPVNLPPSGYAVYSIVEEKSPVPPSSTRNTGFKHHCPYAPAERAREGLENEFIKLEFDPETGGVSSLTNKLNGQSFIRSGACMGFEFSVERPNLMSSWSIENASPSERPALISLARKLDGPYIASIELRFRIKESEICATYELREGDPNLYVNATINWFQKGSDAVGVPALAFAVPLKMAEALPSYEIPFGGIRRDLFDGEEVPALRWAKVSGKLGGKNADFLLMNDCKHGHSFKDGTMRLSLLRSSYMPDPTPEIGSHKMRLAIRLSGTEEPFAECIRRAAEFNHPLRILPTDSHAGNLPKTASALELKTDAVVMTCMKKSEDGSGIVLRFINPSPAESKILILPNQVILGKFKRALCLDLLERPLDTGDIPLKDDASFSLAIPANGIVSLLLQA